jgi:hypothetical protein
MAIIGATLFDLIIMNGRIIFYSETYFDSTIVIYLFLDSVKM